jgi:hypothetical protein
MPELFDTPLPVTISGGIAISGLADPLPVSVYELWGAPQNPLQLVQLVECVASVSAACTLPG